MLNVGTDPGLHTLYLLRYSITITIAQRSPFPWPHGYVPLGIAICVFWPFVNALIPSVCKYSFFFTMEKMLRLGNIVFICSSSMDTMDYR